MSDRVVVLITFELAPELVNQIWAVDPRVEVLYEPGLVGRPRFACDHLGPIHRTPAQERRWQELLAQAEILFGFDHSHPDDLLQKAPGLKWVQSTSAGVGAWAQRAGLAEAGVKLTTASGIHATALAEFALMAMLLFAKDGLGLLREQKHKRWARFTGGELAGKTLGIVGLGRIGREVARLGRCLGMRTLGAKRTTAGLSAQSLGVDALVDGAGLAPLLAQSDYLVISCPHTPETTGLIGAAELALMKPEAVLINVARGAIVDEPALIDALRSDRLKGAALDVTAVEPLPAASPLWELDNVLLSPHSGSNVDSENHALTRLFCDNLQRYLAGEPLRNLLDPARGY
jgi:phosphoglycerate dehydrogenase-like enzyme